MNDEMNSDFLFIVLYFISGVLLMGLTWWNVQSTIRLFKRRRKGVREKFPSPTDFHKNTNLTDDQWAILKRAYKEEVERCGVVMRKIKPFHGGQDES